jgi:integral membrane protein
MGRMANIFDLSTWAKRFRFVAVLEAITWLGLLIGMAFKYLPADGNEVGVKIFGPIHGAVFVLYVLVAIVTAKKLSWSLVTTFWALVASVPPFGTIVFEAWAVRTGRLAELSTDSAKEPAPALS